MLNTGQTANTTNANIRKTVFVIRSRYMTPRYIGRLDFSISFQLITCIPSQKIAMSRTRNSELELLCKRCPDNSYFLPSLVISYVICLTSGPFGIDDEICQVTTRLMACLSHNSAGKWWKEDYSHEKIFWSNFTYQNNKRNVSSLWSFSP